MQLIFIFFLTWSCRCWAGPIQAVTELATTNFNTDQADFTIDSPAGTQVGDVLVAVVADRENLVATTAVNDTATGTLAFTNAVSSNASNVSLTIWYRVVQAGDPTGAAAWTIRTPDDSVAAIMAYRGVDNNNPVDATGSMVNNSPAGVFNGVTTVTNRAWFVGGLAANNAAPHIGAFVSGFVRPSLRANISNALGSTHREAVGLIDVQIPSAGASGTFTYNFAGTFQTHGIALRPATTVNMNKIRGKAKIGSMKVQ